VDTIVNTGGQRWQYVTVRSEFENYVPYFGIKLFCTSVMYLDLNFEADRIFDLKLRQNVP